MNIGVRPAIPWKRKSRLKEESDHEDETGRFIVKENMKKVFLQIFGWPLFRECGTSRQCNHGFSGADGGVDGGIEKK